MAASYRWQRYYPLMPRPIRVPAPDDPREPARRRYLDLTRNTLPFAAREAAGRGESWPVRLDHCFMRIVLDNLVGRRWDLVLNRRLGPAYRQLSAEQLGDAIRMAESMLAEGPRRVRRLNERSLRMRSC